MKSITLEDEAQKDVSMIETPKEKYLDGDLQDAFMSHFDDDPFIKKPSDPPKFILKPLCSGLEYAFL